MAMFGIKSVTNPVLRKQIVKAIERAENILYNFFDIDLSYISFYEPLPFPEEGTIRWQKVLDTNIDISHIRGRKWNETDAVRDLLQNVLDEDDRARVRFNPQKDVIQPYADTVLVWDYGPGITIEAFSIGGTKATPCERGGFGEGLKLSLGTILLSKYDPNNEDWPSAYNGDIIFVNKKGEVFVPVLLSITGKVGRGIQVASREAWLGVIYGKIKGKPKIKRFIPDNFGTLMILPDDLESPELGAFNTTKIIRLLMPKGRPTFIATMPPEVDPETHKLKGNCLKRYEILDEHPENIYIGDLLFHSAKEDSMLGYGKPAVFSYNLWANPMTGEIESSRRNYTLNGEAKMAVKFYHLWTEFAKRDPEGAVEALVKILEANYDNREDVKGNIYIIRDRVGELNVDINLKDEETREILSELMTRAISRFLGRRFGGKPNTITIVSQGTAGFEVALNEKGEVPRDKIVMLKIAPNEISSLGRALYEIGNDKIIVIYDASWPAPKFKDMTTAIYEEMAKRCDEAKPDLNGTFAHAILAGLEIGLIAEDASGKALIQLDAGPNAGDALGLASATRTPNGVVAKIYVSTHSVAKDKRGALRITCRKFPNVLETLIHETAHVLLAIRHGFEYMVNDISEDFERNLQGLATLTMFNKEKMLWMGFHVLPCVENPFRPADFADILNDFGTAFGPFAFANTSKKVTWEDLDTLQKKVSHMDRAKEVIDVLRREASAKFPKFPLIVAIYQPGKEGKIKVRYEDYPFMTSSFSRYAEFPCRLRGRCKDVEKAKALSAKRIALERAYFSMENGTVVAVFYPSFDRKEKKVTYKAEVAEVVKNEAGKTILTSWGETIEGKATTVRNKVKSMLDEINRLATGEVEIRPKKAFDWRQIFGRGS